MSGLEGELAGKEEIPRVTLGYFDKLSPRTEVFNLFLKNDLHTSYLNLSCKFDGSLRTPFRWGGAASWLKPCQASGPIAQIRASTE